jgi:hypothetical protein
LTSDEGSGKLKMGYRGIETTGLNPQGVSSGEEADPGNSRSDEFVETAGKTGQEERSK